MDILTGKCSDRFMAHVLKRRDQEAVRWYVLTLPTAGGGRDKISPSKGLDAELSRRERHDVEARKVGGKMVNTKRPLLYNYVFIHASENEIFSLKRTLPLYKFPYPGFPRVDSLTFPTSRIVRWRPYVGSRCLTPTSFRCTCQKWPPVERRPCAYHLRPFCRHGG